MTTKTDEYPDELAKRNYYDSILGPAEPTIDGKTNFPLPKREYGDNDPSDPDNNWEEEL